MTRKPDILNGKETKPERLGERLGNWVRLFSRRSAAAHSSDQEMPPAPPLSNQDLEGVKTTYLLRLQKRYRTVYIYGLDEKRKALQYSGQTLDRYALYVSLNTTTRVPVEPASSQSSSRDKTRQLSLLEVVGQEQRVLIRGSLGSGRSTFVAFLACALSEQHTPGSKGANGALSGLARLEPGWKHGPMFPVPIDLHDFATSKYADGAANGLMSFIAAELGVLPGQAQKQFIEPGGLVFLFDGLEYASPAVEAFFCRFADTPNCWIITTQGDPGLDGELDCTVNGLTDVSIADLDIEQMDRFVRQWYGELLHKEWIDETAARDLTGQLCTLLRREDVFELAQRRSLLTLIALLCTLHGQLAQNRTLFYHQLINLSFAHWSESKGQDERNLLQILNVEELRMAVAQVTYQSYARLDPRTSLVELPEADLRATLASVCHEGQWQVVSELVSRILTRPGLLEQTRPGFFAFPYLSLQSYVAARYLAAQPELPQLITRLAYEDFYRWREVIGFVIGRLILLDENLGLVLKVLDALYPQSMLPERMDQSTVTQVAKDKWRQVWLVGECLARVEAAFLEMDKVFPERAAPLLERVRCGLAALLDYGMLTPIERTSAGSILARLPGDDPRPGVCQSEPLWCQVPRSAFWQGMGDDAHLVEQGAFWIARYPVTNAQYAFFVGETGYKAPDHWQGTRPPDSIRNHPVVQVTWKDADAFCRWLSGRIHTTSFQTWQNRVERGARVPGNYIVRLPTSAEWEKAARGGVSISIAGGDGMLDNPMPQRAYPWGNGWQLSTADVAGDETRCNVSESNIGTTTPVGMYPDGASPYGVLDMAGNVWEWCYDWVDDQAQYKVRRGGAFRYSHDQARCSAFDKAHPGLGWPYMGFRIVYGPSLPE
ncbi:MAG: SUMF1/EgtB/PvdO family nonheme iron enzyme [Anaerolineae bacterium]|nr:SUMF1/EgtB/PvdO family nonheme iron enzyme [Anaerolineae bacterium]